MTAYSSAQDFATGMARTWALLAECAEGRKANDHQAKFEEALHQAMGYRAEHSDPLAF